MDSVDFVSPVILLLLLLLVPLWYWWRAGSRGTRGLLTLTLRVLVLAALILALARPRLVDQVKKLAVAFVVDVSESVPVAERDLELRRIERDLEKMPEEDRASLIVFADRPSVEIPFAGMREGDAGVVARLDHLESRVTLTESNLARAIEFAEGTFPSDYARRIVLVSDGNQTRGDLHSAARALRASGARLDVRPIAYRFDEEVLVEGLHAPEHGRIDEPLQLRAVISSLAVTDAEITLKEDGVELGAPARVKLDRGTNVLRFSPVPTWPGVHQYEIVVRSARDGNPANNVARAGVMVGGAPTVLVIAPQDHDERLEGVLAEAGLAVKRTSIALMPSHPAGYVSVDTVVLDNVPAYSLDESQMKALEDAVRDLGVGLVVVGGDRSFGPGGYRGTPLEELLPVDLRTTNKKTMPKGALVIVLHSIEFDSGNTWAVRICESALRGLNAQDEAGVVYYDSTLGERWLFDLAPLGDGQQQRSLIRSCFVGDMPSFQNCFVLAEASLARSDAAVKHVVVISDGDPQIPDPALISRLVQDRVTISTICIQPHGAGSVATMQSLASRGGGRFRQLFPSRGDLSKLPKLMLKESATLRRAAIKEEPFLPITLLGGSPLLRGIGGEWPRLGGYVITSIRPGAETILLANEKEDDPLLAAWHAGLGRVVAFTSDASSRWASDWLSWERFGPLWSQIVRSTLLESEQGEFPFHASVDGLELEVVLEARDIGGSPITDLRLDGVALGEGQERVPFEPKQEEAGRYVARVEVPAQGHYLLRVGYESDAGSGHVMTTAAIDYAPEYRSLRSREEALLSAAAITGGAALGPEDSPFEHDFVAVRGRVEIWPHLLILAMVLLVLEITARRFDVDLTAFWRARAERRRERAQARAEPGSDDEGIVFAEPEQRTETAEPEAPVRKPEPQPSDAAATLEELRKAKDRAARRREWK